MANQTIRKVELSCHLSLPSKITIPDNILLSGEYELCIYTGTKPATLNEKPEGRLISKGRVGRANPIIDSGRASYFIILKDKQAIYMGNIGTSGCSMILPTTKLVKGGSFIVDDFSE